jgi:hypothetical protein
MKWVVIRCWNRISCSCSNFFFFFFFFFKKKFLFCVCGIAYQMEKLNKVLAWLQNKSNPALTAVEEIVFRLCRNFRIDLRPDFNAPLSGHELSDVPNVLLTRSCRVGRRLKLVLDTVVLAKRATEPMPKFLSPTVVSLKLPEFAHHIDDAKLQVVFGKLLYAFLLKIWTPLRYTEELLTHLNSYCAGVQDLARDASSQPGVPPKDANAIALAVLEQLKRIDSNLSRIEVFVITKHHQPSMTQISQLQDLRTQYMRATCREEDYRKKKSETLDKLVDFNLQQFRPTG